jgi:hypothetical protein
MKLNNSKEEIKLEFDKTTTEQNVTLIKKLEKLEKLDKLNKIEDMEKMNMGIELITKAGNEEILDIIE